jgi:iron transport multicopper oxidase
MDGTVGTTQCAIPPGGWYVYNITTENLEGTFFWSATYKAQQADGLKGPFIIKNPERPTFHNNDVTVQLSDWYHHESKTLLNQYFNTTKNPDLLDPLPNSALLNGRGHFNCSETQLPCVMQFPTTFTVRKESLTRLRLLNLGSVMSFKFSIDHHFVTVVETDGVETEPYTVQELDIHVGQRYT